MRCWDVVKESEYSSRTPVFKSFLEIPYFSSTSAGRMVLAPLLLVVGFSSFDFFINVHFGIPKQVAALAKETPGISTSSIAWFNCTRL